MQTPYVLQGPHGLDAQAKKSVIACSGSAAIALGSLVTTAGAAVASGETGAAYIVDRILLSDGITLKANQYLNATEAAAAAHLLAVTPLGGGVTLAMGEDGNLTDADLITSGKKYAEIIVSAPTDIALGETSGDGHAAAHANIRFDSSDASTDATGRQVEILRVISPANFDKNSTATTTLPSSWSAGTGRVFEVRIVPALSPPTE